MRNIQTITSDSMISKLAEARISSQAQGTSYKTDDSGLIVVMTDSDKLTIGTNFKESSQIVQMDVTLPVLVHYLDCFSHYSDKMQDAIQAALVSNHSATYDFFHDNKLRVPKEDRLNSLQTFCFCSNGIIKIEDNKLFLVAVTGPDRKNSEGTVLAIAAEGKSDILLSGSNNYKLANVYGLRWKENYSRKTLDQLHNILIDTDVQARD